MNRSGLVLQSVNTCVSELGVSIVSFDVCAVRGTRRKCTKKLVLQGSVAYDRGKQNVYREVLCGAGKLVSKANAHANSDVVLVELTSVPV
jgi:hypothetical protein